MAQSSHINEIFKSREHIISFLKNQGFNVADYESFSIHDVNAMYQAKQMDMLFKKDDRLFYPYGASLDKKREVMAPNLLMWEAIKYGQSLGLKSFDTWGCLGPNAKEGEQGFGFHKFKQGYGGTLVQFVGTYDLIINPTLYKIYNAIDKYRWIFLRAKAALLR